MAAPLFQALFCYVAPGLLALVGAWHVAFPTAAWKLGRLGARSAGIATDDQPARGALTVIRLRGVFFLLVATAFAVFSQAFFRGMAR